MDIDEISEKIVHAAYKTHIGLGLGLLESVYETLMVHELTKIGFSVERQKTIAFEYDGLLFDEGLRVDLLVNRLVIVELKSVEKLAQVHYKQVLTYLRLLNLQVGLLINFGAHLLKDGLHRVVNQYKPPRLRASA
ncbi:MAG TPA: GxxExxY protein [Anaerolineaceae bacterium]|nr:GxxExxY protein [Anaerolineaceae bacterium]